MSVTGDNQIDAPALRGDDPLGFMAALGVLSLAHTGVIPSLRLGWSAGLSPHAVFESSSFRDASDMISDLGRVLDALLESDRVLPGALDSIPLKKEGTGSDPNRMSQLRAADLYRSANDRWIHADDPWTGRWIGALYGQCAVDDKNRIRLTPLYAPFAQMSLRTSLFEKTMEAVQEVDGPGDALTGWLRTEPSLKYDGANLDSRAKRDGVTTTDGDPANQGAPSPTWLAVLSTVLMPLAERSGRWGAVGWQAVRLRRDLTRRSLVWPIWDGFLDTEAARALVGHPALRVSGEDSEAHIHSSSTLPGLGVRAVYGSSRSTQSQGDGPLAAALRLWPLDGDREITPSFR